MTSQSHLQLTIVTKMLLELKNFLFYFPINLLYFIGKFQGLIVFTFETFPAISFKISPLFCLYSKVYSVAIVIAVHIVIFRIVSWVSYLKTISKKIILFVYCSELCIAAYKVMVVYVMQLYNRKHWKAVMANAVHLHRSLNELLNGPITFQKRFICCYACKIAGVVYQFFVIFSLTSLYRWMKSVPFAREKITFYFLIYMHLTSIIISSLYYAGMMFILMIYENLTRKAVEIFTSSVELNCKFSHRWHHSLIEEIEQTIHVYGKVLEFLKKFSRLFSVQLLFASFNAFWVVVVEVFMTFYLVVV